MCTESVTEMINNLPCHRNFGAFRRSPKDKL